jgi:hypothetical protein
MHAAETDTDRRRLRARFARQSPERRCQRLGTPWDPTARPPLRIQEPRDWHGRWLPPPSVPMLNGDLC